MRARGLIPVSATAAVLVAVVLALLLAGGADTRSTTLPQQRGSVDLAIQANVEIQGAAPSHATGDAVAAAGDVNGDGLGDVVVGAPAASFNGRAGSGSAYVVFGQSAPAKIDLATLGARGYRIDGAAAGDRVGSAVAGVGDVNGDGRADLLVGAQNADFNGRSSSGSAYLVYGKGSGLTVDLSSLAAQGIRIDGATPTERAGGAVAAAGDVNGDGRPDLLVGASFADNSGRSGSGSAYVVFGRSSPVSVDLAALGEQGFRIDGAAPQDFTAEAIAGAGDVNGDGRADVLLGAAFADNNGRELSGSVYVVFGTASSAPVDLSALGAGGYRIDGAAAGDTAGTAVSAGDVNGDGRADILVGAPFADNNERSASGSAYIVLGTGASANVDLAALGGDHGFRMDGAAPTDFAGGSIAGVGDVNDDGRGDVLVGAAQADANGRQDSGSAYVVYGKGSSEVVDFASLGAQGFRIDGAAAEDSAGGAVAAAGDVNKDDRPDVLVGAPGADANGRPTSGSVFVVYGFGEPQLAYRPLRATAGRAIRPHAPRLVRHTGLPRFSVSRPLPAGLRLDPDTGAISGTPLSFARETVYTVTLADLVGAARAALTITVTDTRAPRLRLAGPPAQSVQQRAVVVRVSCNEPSRLTARGSVTSAGTAVVRLRRARATVSRAGTVKLALALPPSARERLARLLDSGARARATITVRAVDLAGNERTATRTVRIVDRSP